MLRVHFLNVGHGDCTIIKHHSGRLTMIDINNSQTFDKETYNELLNERVQAKSSNSFNPLGVFSNALTGSGILSVPPKQYEAREEVEVEAKRDLADPIAFLQKNYPGQRLWRFVLTHPDLDHMRGLKRLSETVGFNNFWDTKNTKPTPASFWSEADKEDWKFYQNLRSGNLNITSKYYTRGTSVYAFGRDENGLPGGDNIEILSPTDGLIENCNSAGKSNSLSLVLRITHAGKSIILPGDAEEDAWDIMVEKFGKNLKSDFLKAPHHGRDSAYHLKAVQLICPKIVFVSVGRKPDTDASSKYRQQSNRVASTRYHGNIELRVHDDGNHQWIVDRNPD